MRGDRDGQTPNPQRRTYRWQALNPEPWNYMAQLVLGPKPRRLGCKPQHLEGDLG